MAQPITPLHTRSWAQRILYTNQPHHSNQLPCLQGTDLPKSERRFSGTKPRCGIPNASLLLPWLHAGGSPSVELGVVDGTVNGGPWKWSAGCRGRGSRIVAGMKGSPAAWDNPPPFQPLGWSLSGPATTWHKSWDYTLLCRFIGMKKQWLCAHHTDCCLLAVLVKMSCGW